MLVPYNDPDLLHETGNAAESPYVIAMTRAGIHTLPGIVNAAILTSAFSAGNSFLFCSSRILYGLALRGQAPRIFTYCTKKGLPIVAIAAAVSCLDFTCFIDHKELTLCDVVRFYLLVIHECEGLVRPGVQVSTHYRSQLFRI